MSTANRTPSPGATPDRDHAADSDDSLARKRQRLSQEPDFLIEALAPEDNGSTFSSAIIIDDGVSEMLNYSESFHVVPGCAPIEQLEHLMRAVDSNTYFDPALFEQTHQWVQEHLRTTANQKSQWQQRYIDDEQFFHALGRFALRLLDSPDALDVAVLARQRNYWQSVILSLYRSLVDLSIRMLSFLPIALDGVLARRDSAQPPVSGQQQVPLTVWLRVLSKLLDEGAPMTFHIVRALSLDTGAVVELLADKLVGSDVPLKALDAVLRTLSTRPRDFSDAWVAIDNTIAAFSLTVQHVKIGFHANAATTVIESMITTINTLVVPAVCQKHPRALPDHFHERVIVHVGHMLYMAVAHRGTDSVLDLYQSCWKSASDPLPSGLTDGDVSGAKLSEICHGNQTILAGLMRNLWLFQVLKGFVSTDILDIRSLGITTLRVTLLDAWNSHGGEHRNVILSFLAQFLREGNFTEYIFSADSHANLVKESSDIVGFLAVTHKYTDRETDIIWRACTTSVEAEFVRASFDVLTSLVHHANVQQMLYMAEKFTTIPQAAVSVYAVTFFERLLNKLRANVDLADNSVDRLAPSRICLAILWNQESEEPAVPRNGLYKLASSEITALRTADFSPEDRLELYKLCHEQFASRGPHLKSSLEVLNCFLRPDTDSEAGWILDLFPVSAVVAEMAEYVRLSRSQNQPLLHHVLAGVNVRLVACLRLIGLSDCQQDPQLEEVLWAHTIGDRALNSQAREYALDLFISNTAGARFPSRVVNLFNRCIDEFLPAMSADCATVRLANFLFGKIASTELVATNTTPEALLETQAWKQLYRIATTSPSEFVADEAIGGICKVLFGRHELRLDMSFLSRQAAFVRRHIEHLGSLQQNEVEGSARSEHSKRLMHRAINILGTLLAHGRASADGYDAKPHLIMGGNDASERINFTVKITGQFPKVCTFDSSPRCTLEQLERALASVTGASEHVLVRGPRTQSLSETELLHQSLEEAGVNDASVLLVHPRYSFDCDLGKLFSNSNAVEEEIMANYALLDALLDSEGETAEKIYNFLVMIPPPSSVRLQVISSDAVPDKLFPHDRCWRTMYSVHVLSVHLLDCNRLGIADQDFIIHGARQVSHVLTDTARPLPASLLSTLLVAINNFLQGLSRPDTLEASTRLWLTISTERPKSSPPPPYLLDAERLGFRLFELLPCIQSMPLASTGAPQVHTRGMLTKATYNAFIQLSRTENMWHKCADTQQFIDAHSCLLLAKDATISRETSMLMRNFAKETPEARSAYMHALNTTLPNALTRKCDTNAFFALFREMVMLDESMRSDEGRVRAFIAALVKHVRQYHHVESPDVAIADDTLANLLNLLSATIDVLKSLKQPLHLEQLSEDLFRRLLFAEAKPRPLATDQDRDLVAGLVLRPNSNMSTAEDEPRQADASVASEVVPEVTNASQPLFHSSSRAICLDIVRKTSGTAESRAWLIEQISELTQMTARHMHGFPSYWFRPIAASAGLSNLGMTCYMNSLLQQVYGNIQLRKVIFDTPITNASKQGLLQQVQALFARMQNTAKASVETLGLAKYLGIHVDTQEDVHGFYTTFMSGLEQCMPDAETKTQFTRMFSGKLATQIRGSCGHVSSLTEPFSDLSVTVQNKSSLEDSLAEFVQGEPMQGANKYKCLSCDADEGGKLVDAMKRTCLDEVPDHLTVCLKRFTYDMLGHESKNNDYFEFPEEIDLSKYQREHLETPETETKPDVFELVGVIVHSGILTFGHYWSYVRLRGYTNPDRPRWVRLEDRNAREAGGFEEVRKECYGGATSTHNGYVLFYQRKTSFDAASAVAETVDCSPRQQNLMPPRVQAPDALAREISSDNLHHHRLGQLFDDSFHKFVVNILKEAMVRSPVDSAEDDAELSSPVSRSSSDSNDRRSPAQNPTDTQLAEMIYNYLTHVVFSDSKAEKASELFQTIKTQAPLRPQLVHHLLKRIANDQDCLWSIARIKDNNLKSAARLFIGVDCPALLREHDPDNHDSDIRRLIATHSGLLQGLEAFPETWYNYFCLPYELASSGPDARRTIMNEGYFEWIFNTLHWKVCPRVPGYKSLHEIMKKRDVDFTPLYEFLSAFLGQLGGATIDLEDFAKGGQLSGAQGLITPVRINASPVLPWMCAALSMNPRNMQDPNNYAPARLMRVLCNSGSGSIQRVIHESMMACISEDEYYSRPIFLMNVPLHDALADDPTGAEILTALIHGMLNFERPQVRLTLDFLTTIYTHSPENVLHTVKEWGALWLAPDSRFPKRTENWLNTHLFSEAPLTQVPGEQGFGTSLDAVRVKTACTLVRHCAVTLREAHEMTEQSTFAPMMNVMQLAQGFFDRFVKACRTVEEAGQELSVFALEVLNQAKTGMVEAGRLLIGFQNWDADALAIDEDDMEESSAFESDDEDF